MNGKRVLMGGLVGGLVYNAVSFLINAHLLMPRYQILHDQGHLRQEPRLPFALYCLLLFVVSIGLVWLYAAARTHLGPGPRSALLVGLVVGLIAGVPMGLVEYSWGYYGGYVSLWWTLDRVLGSALATLVGGWVYKD